MKLPDIPPNPEYKRALITDYNPLRGSTKRREIWMPNPDMLGMQQRFLRSLERLQPELPYATGARKGDSPARNVERHAGNRYFYLLDLASAYEQVDMLSLAWQLHGLGMEGDVNDTYDFLERYCRPPGGDGLATGSPTAPFLFNVYCQQLDVDLGTYAKTEDLTYTRYLDDLTFSAADTGFPTRDVINPKKRAEIREIVDENGFKLSVHKTRVSDAQDAPVIITGLQLNREGHWQVPERYLRIAQMYLEQLMTSSPRDACEYAAGILGLLTSSKDRTRHAGIQAANHHRLQRLAEAVIRSQSYR